MVSTCILSKPVATSIDATQTRMNELVHRPPLRNKFHLTDIHQSINVISSYFDECQKNEIYLLYLYCILRGFVRFTVNLVKNAAKKVFNQ